ncbi:hypothetical protein [Rhizobium leguminosarum]|uniref:Uncharacterized protein n=1 Tax=Rhizobium leguminosarum TaxID=384 RepID=A0A7K3VTF0_RHILE|nr:hypothetical protein [Rhizobium leguminosarum]NEK19798.1 hypothetical protein [Rhizobium leguminosarum]NEK34367.1 hypothetical protein [Rhizobium leguminosarum]
MPMLLADLRAHGFAMARYLTSFTSLIDQIQHRRRGDRTPSPWGGGNAFFPTLLRQSFARARPDQCVSGADEPMDGGLAERKNSF